jgi:diacylglycerol O-acyltransferase / wax synthase
MILEKGVDMSSLSHADAAWLHMETPTNLMMITGLVLLDSVPDRSWMEAVLEHRLCHYQRFRMKVVESKTFGLPHWELLSDFQVGSHLVYEQLEEPSQEAFLTRVAELMSQPLDRSRPLWEFRVFPGVEGRCAIAVRFHHAIADGIAMMRVLLSLCDKSVDAPRPSPEDEPEHFEERSKKSTFARAKGLTSFLLHEGHDLLFHPARATKLAGQGFKAGKSLAHVLALPPDAPNAFQGILKEKKLVALSRPIELARFKNLGKKLGCTINDVLMGVLAGALGRTLKRKQDLTEDFRIRVVVPVDLRGGDVAKLGNRFGLVFLTLPVGEPDPAERLKKVHDSMTELKESAEAVVTFELLSTVGALPADIEKEIIKWFGSKASAVVTNLPGPRETLYMAGSKINGVMYWVPQSGRLAVGISLMSYAGQVRLGVTTDASIVSNPQKIVDDFMDALEEMQTTEAS